MSSVACLRKRLSNTLRGFCHDVDGATAVLISLLLPVIIGGVGLGAETGYWYFLQRELQHMADVSAHAAGIRLRSGDETDQLQAAALDVATKAGYSGSDATLTLNWPPASGSYAGNTNAVEVVLTKTVPRLFSAVFSDAPVSMNARAVARVRFGSDACVLALSPNTPAALTVTSMADVSLDCDAASDSFADDSFSVQGNGALSARCGSAVGGAYLNTRVTLSECTSVHEYAPWVPDPYRDVAEPTVPAFCNSNNRNLGNPQHSVTISPTSSIVSGMPVYHFCDGVFIKGNVTFEPGLYIISGGDFDANAGAVINGTGVTFFITSPNKVHLNGHAELHLSAPTSGELSGILVFASRSGSGLIHQFNGTAGTVVQGAIYAPTTGIDYTGDSSSTGAGGCTQVIGYTVRLDGNTGMASDCEDAGTSDIKIAEVVKLVE
jgi:Flp pilus assembly protein TadG